MHRKAIRITSAVALLLSAASCSEQLVAGRGRVANLAIVPEMSLTDQSIYRSLAAFALNVDNVHVMIFRPATEEILADTVVQFSVTSSQIAIQVSVQLAAAEETLSALIALRGGTTTLFSGSQTVTARVGQTTGDGRPVSLTYVGPGSTATLLRITPRTASTFVGGQTPLVAMATDVQGLVIQDYPFAWSTGDPAIATINDLGVLTGVATGTTSVIARGITGIADTVPVTIGPAPVGLVAVSGEAQSGTVALPLSAPFVVQAQTSTGAGVPGVPIAFRVTSGTATLQNATVVTDSKGNAANTLTLGNVAGAITIEARTGALPALTLHASATPGAASQLIPVNATISAYLNGAPDKPPAVRVADSFGNTVALGGLAVNFTLGDTLSLFSTTQTRFATVNTDATGVATAPSFTMRSQSNIQIQALATLPSQQRVTTNIAVSYLGVTVP